MDRILSTALFALSMICLAAALLLLLNGFIEYLQLGRWRLHSLLDAAYDLRLVKARWFLASDLGSVVRSLLQQIPAFAALLCFAPVAWWLSKRFGTR